MEETQEQKISKYSSGVNILIRIDLLWKKTHIYAETGLYNLLNTTLDRIWLELARDLKADRYENQKENFDKFDNELKSLMPFNDEKPSGFRSPSQIEIENREKIYKVLMKKQLFLSRLENEVGKGTTFDDDDDDDFD